MFEIALAAHDAAVAQLAERLPCKQDVGSAILSSGSKYKSPFCQSGPDCKICAVEAGLQDKTYWLFGPWR